MMKSGKLSLWVLGAVSAMFLYTYCLAGNFGDFQIEDEGTLIPISEIYSGGPAKDGIPSIDTPRFYGADEVSGLTDDARVLGLVSNGIAKAYPIAIMNWHEIVNDRFGDQQVAITFCPLCGSGIAYLATHSGQGLSFGVSGLLYNNDVLLYDRQTESLWSQILSQAVTGPMSGTKLKMLPLTHTNWSDWKQRHPETLVLSRQTGFDRDYDSDPYSGYEDEVGVYFPVKHRSGRYHPKERVLGLEINGHYKAYPFTELGRTEGDIEDEFAGKRFFIKYDDQHRSGRVFSSDGVEIPTITSFWFAWYAFHPDTGVYTAVK
ncbi:MAG: DUF3179 domain-containing protein [Candidatus Sedimenticola sp. (ex Thyasira tokunagai)]